MKKLLFDSVYEKLKLRIDEVQDEFIKKKLLKLYLKSPSKVQYVLSRYFIKSVLNKKAKDLEEIIRH